ncbi:MAG: hypothetical protein QOH13_16, partial [Thermoleophilaceae bacterium]|nr:hypothetical protein [Thermoleophilaceae bacterium]
MRLTPQQQAAVDRRDGPLFVHAGAGSGKTSVLVERFVRAAHDDGAGIDGVLAITFTEKAAAEMKLRIRSRFAELGERELARETERAWVSTIHGFCSRVLRAHPLAAGIDPEYRVLDEGEAARLALQATEQAMEDFLGDDPQPDRLELIAAYGPDRLGGLVRQFHARRRSRPFISAAAFSVNVIARIRSTGTPSSSTARTNRSTSTRVLPLPAPACRN